MNESTVVPVVPVVLAAPPVTTPGVAPFIQLLGQSGAGRCEGDSCGI
jgi:hypothetical protein